MSQHSTSDSIGKMLFRFRNDQKKKIPMAKIAKAIGVSESVLSKIERGITQKPQRTTVDRIVKYLNKHGYFPKVEAA